MARSGMTATDSRGVIDDRQVTWWPALLHCCRTQITKPAGLSRRTGLCYPAGNRICDRKQRPHCIECTRMADTNYQSDIGVDMEWIKWWPESICCEKRSWVYCLTGLY